MPSPRLFPLVAMLLALNASVARGQEPPPAMEEEPLTLLFTSGFRGRCSEVDCRKKPGVDLVRLMLGESRESVGGQGLTGTGARGTRGP